MSSSLSAESTPLGSRAVLSLSVFASMGLGNISASIVFLVLLEAFQSGVESNIHYVEWVWRLFLGLGMIPAAVTLYARWTMAETAPYEKCMSHLYQKMRVRRSNLSRCIKGPGHRTGREARAKRTVSGLCCLLQRMETCQSSICNLSILVSLVRANLEFLKIPTDKWCSQRYCLLRNQPQPKCHPRANRLRRWPNSMDDSSQYCSRKHHCPSCCMLPQILILFVIPLSRGVQSQINPR